MLKYKLTTQKITTHNGHKWFRGEWQRITEPGDRMCSDEVFHYYDHPLVAVLMNSIHANIPNPLLWEVEVYSTVAHDGVKGGCKDMVLRALVEIPALTIQHRVEVAIRLALVECFEPTFIKWAKNWLDGSDRSPLEASAVAASAAECAPWHAATAAECAATAAAAAAAECAPWPAECAAECAAATAVAASAAAAAQEDWSVNTLIPTLELVYNRDSRMKESK